MDKITSPTPIAILMATYNGERYVKEQLDSLVRQDNDQWTLFIHDDGSSDSTPQILRQYADSHANIHVLDYAPQGGAMKNFFSLLQRVEADYYMFCDQDDVWKKEKVSISLEEMKNMESQHKSKPVIVFTDLHVTDSSLAIIQDSFWREICLYPEYITTFDEIAASTAVTGCAMLFNQKAKDAIVFPAPYATMHDTWITACVLKHGGVIKPIPSKMVFYRQHEDNCIGAEDLNHITLMYRIKNFKRMQQKNWKHYKMLRSLDYGSIVKFFRYKMIYKKRIRNKMQK